jgi:hypothetical protein
MVVRPSMIALFIAAVWLALGTEQAGAETMRCGRWVISSSTAPSEILAKCGTPTSKEVERSDVWAPRNDGVKGTHVVGQTVTERWIYRRGSQQFTMVVTIRDGRTISVTALKP